ASLKVLKLQITDIPRPDIKDRDGAVQEKYPGHGRQIQNQVYERLARLVNLETLWLGHYPECLCYKRRKVLLERQRGCLEMSLESGLAKLEGLKALRELGVAYMETRIRPMDVRWMSEHWPSLRVICGMIDGYDSDDDDEGECFNQEAVSWLEEHCPRILAWHGWGAAYDDCD
ncbi:hypothetical protein BGX26_008044, partial [Mortierella sp. AD094]